eukprot:6201266-Pleurochrysis_carterae.AAC.4
MALPPHHTLEDLEILPVFALREVRRVRDAQDDGDVVVASEFDEVEREVQAMPIAYNHEGLAVWI